MTVVAWLSDAGVHAAHDDKDTSAVGFQLQMHPNHQDGKDYIAARLGGEPGRGWRNELLHLEAQGLAIPAKALGVACGHGVSVGEASPGADPCTMDLDYRTAGFASPPAFFAECRASGLTTARQKKTSMTGRKRGCGMCASKWR